jgi:hypothetical protein
MTFGVPRERPTATTPPRDLSRASGRVSAAPAGLRVTEGDLWRAYAGEPAMRVERCACGGAIVADAGDPARAVWAHNESPGHEAWALAAGWR